MMWPENQGVFAGTSWFGISSTGNGAYGSYSQVVASTDYPMVGFWLTPMLGDGVGYTAAMKVAVGAASSEEDIIDEVFFQGGSTLGRLQSGVPQWIPVNIPAGSRIAVASKGGTSSLNYYYEIIPLYSSMEGEARSVGKFDRLTGAWYSTVVSGGVTNTWGSWTQITASTSRRYNHLLIRTGFETVSASGTTSFMYWEIAVGPSSSEQVIYNFVAMKTANSSGSLVTAATAYSLPIVIPAGSRISARSKSSNEASANGHLSLWGG